MIMERIEFNSEKSGENSSNPIKNGEVFDPEEKIVSVLKESKGNRVKKLKEFKEKINFQKKGLSELQRKIMDEIKENPDINHQELVIKIEPFIDKYGLSDGQISRIHEMIGEYEERHDAVLKFVSEYPDSKSACGQLFKFNPEGEVDMLVSPITIHFRFLNFTDFVRAQSDNQKKPTNEELNKYRNTNGLHLRKQSFGELEECIVLENVSGRDTEDIDRTSTHELQHAISDFYEDMVVSMMKNENPYVSGEYLWDSGERMIKSCKNENDFREGIKKFFESIKIRALSDAQSEIISWLSTGEKTEELGDIIKYYSHLKIVRKLGDDAIKNLLKFYGKEFRNIDYSGIMDEVAGEGDFYKIIDAALGAVKKAESLGMSRLEIISRIRMEQMAKWPRIIDEFKA